MILFCRYGVDPAAPEKGVIVAWHEEVGAPDASVYPGTIAVPHAGKEDDFGRFGPAPEKLGEPVSVRHHSHEELDALGFEADHGLRKVAGILMPDNRREALDLRPWAAPDLTLEVARKAASFALGRACEAAHVGGFPSKAVGSIQRYPSDDAAVGKLQLAAIAALAGQAKPGWTATLALAGVDVTPSTMAHTAAQVHAVVGDYQTFIEDLHAKRSALKSAIDAAADPAAALAIRWA